ncbi:hypothetical protein HPT27_11970 [Permianibacter sp. IMCC34836]|uniref:hypothetical protein n=1 Tax=Permianibacter fluminis TaxID=2738515 RepID=UPI0015542CCE|nr:hypothetical protein [Permianibacter fluminis]NQD37744.1 hypothetical protein [Permianibacter fluminis]
MRFLVLAVLLATPVLAEGAESNVLARLQAVWQSDIADFVRNVGVLRNWGVDTEKLDLKKAISDLDSLQQQVSDAFIGGDADHSLELRNVIISKLDKLCYSFNALAGRDEYPPVDVTIALTEIGWKIRYMQELSDKAGEAVTCKVIGG